MRAFSKVPADMPESKPIVIKPKELKFSVETKVQMRVETDAIIQSDARKTQAHLIGPIQGGKALKYIHSLNSKRPNAFHLKLEFGLPDQNQPIDLQKRDGKQELKHEQNASEHSFEKSLFPVVNHTNNQTNLVEPQIIISPVKNRPADISANIFINQGPENSVVLSQIKMEEFSSEKKRYQAKQPGSGMNQFEQKEKRRFKIFSPISGKGHERAACREQDSRDINGQSEEKLKQMNHSQVEECSSHNIHGQEGLNEDSCLQCALIKQYLKPRNSKLKLPQ